VKNKIHFTTPLVFSLLFSFVKAQTNSPEVIASGGDFFTSTSFSNSFTVGEMAAVETFSATNFILTQGFQQTENLISTGNDALITSDGFNIYPNPARNTFFIELPKKPTVPTEITLYNHLAEIVTETEIHWLGDKLIRISSHALANGIYLVKINSENSTIVKKIIITH
jgi:hypothetical protein